MRTTLNIPDLLLREAKLVAAREGMTLSALAEEGLLRVVAEKRAGRRVLLRKTSFKGRGLSADLADTDWDRIRNLAYES
jgi:hypothetical protein